MGSPSGSLPELDGSGYRATTMEDKINEIYLQLPLFLRNTSRIENCVQMLSQTAASQTTKIRVWNRLLRASWLALPLWKQVQPLALAAPTRQDHGTDPDIAMAPQPLGLSGPMALGHLMTVEIQDEDLIHSQAPKMNKHEVPFYSGSLANNTSKGLHSGSIPFGKKLVC